MEAAGFDLDVADPEAVLQLLAYQILQPRIVDIDVELGFHVPGAAARSP